MKLVPANIPRTVVTRVALAWAVLSLLAGAGALYLELGGVNRLVHDLAATEALERRRPAGPVTRSHRRLRLRKVTSLCLSSRTSKQ